MTDSPAAIPAFPAANLALFGVLQDLASDSAIDAANAWLRAACDFTPGPLTTATLTVTAYDAHDRLALQQAWSRIAAALSAHAGYKDEWSSTTLTVHLADGTTAPEATAQGLADLAHRARDKVARPEFDRLAPSKMAALPEQTEALTRALVSARVVHASSQSCGDYQVIAVSPEHRADLAALSSAVHDISAAIYRTGLGAGLNNLSPVVADVTTQTLAEALAGHLALAAATGPQRVGVITPGGVAAPQDVLSKLNGRLDLEVTATPVFLSDGSDLTRRMIGAVGHLTDQGAAAIVIGFGGGELATLQRVHTAVTTAVDGLRLPVYVGIGHHNFADPVPGAHVRTCTTPADAASLFVVESLEAPVKRAHALARSARDMRAAGVDADAHARAKGKLDIELTRIDDELAEQRRRHLQPATPATHT